MTAEAVALGVTAARKETGLRHRWWPAPVGQFCCAVYTEDDSFVGAIHVGEFAVPSLKWSTKRERAQLEQFAAALNARAKES